MWVQCEIQALADSGPLTLTHDDFSLIDGSGTVHNADFFAVVATPDYVMFPEGEVLTGQTVQGTVVIPVPANAPGPWVIEVNPVAFIVTMQEPGTLVLDGELQPFEVFGQ